LVLSYNRPAFLCSAHLETIYPALLRKVAGVVYDRERIQTPDDDFLDLDWLRQGVERVVIISHGLEGNTSRAYMKGMAQAFYNQNFDVLAWNFRGCSGEVNKQLRFYHSGATDDLDCVVEHVIGKGYKEIYLVAFSLGANMMLKYLGEKNPRPEIKKAVMFSVPMHLHSSCLKISKASNWIYSNRFLRSLKSKIIAKSLTRTELDLKDMQKIKTLIDFDDRYTAPLHGFNDALDYYQRCSSINFVESIKTPTLIVNAQNDPFLSDACYPRQLLKRHAFVKFEDPGFGGHVGFAQFTKNGLYWSEERALSFITTD
jgi:predicted alpha/beta-fold hydrolase